MGFEELLKMYKYITLSLLVMSFGFVSNINACAPMTSDQKMALIAEATVMKWGVLFAINMPTLWGLQTDRIIPNLVHVAGSTAIAASLSTAVSLGITMRYNSGLERYTPNLNGMLAVVPWTFGTAAVATLGYNWYRRLK